MSFRKNVGYCAVYLLILIGLSQQVRADGLPGEYLLTQRWRGMIAHHSPFTNPALMTEENYISLRAALAPTHFVCPTTEAAVIDGPNSNITNAPNRIIITHAA